MIKCDIIIPIYNAPEYVNFCVFALFNNTDMNRIGNIFLQAIIAIQYIIVYLYPH